MEKRSFLFLLFTLFCSAVFSQATIIQYLSGTDKDHTVPWDFFCTGGRNSGKWSTIPVPSNWELQGFGACNYGHDKVKSNEQGLYRYKFPAGNWQGKRTFIVFEGSTTDTKVMIDGVQAGPVHQGSFYQCGAGLCQAPSFSGRRHRYPGRHQPHRHQVPGCECDGPSKSEEPGRWTAGERKNNDIFPIEL